MSDTLALVESPAQLLNVLEWAHVHPGEAASLTIAVLQPVDPRSRAQVRRLCRFASQAKVVWRRYEVRAGYLGRAGELMRLGRAVAAADRLVIGDLFSRTIQLLLPRSRAREVVVVDDGTATTELVSLLTYGQQLTRWHQGDLKPSAKGGPVNRWLARDGLDRAVFFTCMPVTAPPVPRCGPTSTPGAGRPSARSGCAPGPIWRAAPWWRPGSSTRTGTSTPSAGSRAPVRPAATWRTAARARASWNASPRSRAWRSSTPNCRWSSPR